MKNSVIRVTAVLMGIGFSVFYVGLYRVLIGEFVIHRYPSWPPWAATVYIAGGILLQAWLCFRTGPPTGLRLLAQAAAGILYIAALALLPGGTYMT